MPRSRLIAAFVVLAGCSPLRATTDDDPKPHLLVGDRVPDVGADVVWLKGEPVPKFEKGRVYVLDFWATWCGPCIAGIPHLSETAEKYKDRNVTVVGLAILPMGRGSDPADFVKRRGRKMAYTVGNDVDEALARRYFYSTGGGGIPRAMIVDRHGRLAWLGHPNKGMDEALEQIVAGTWDLAKARKQFNADIPDKARRTILQRKAMRLAEEGDYAEAVRACEQLEKLVKKRSSVASLKFKYLLALPDRRKEAYALAREMIEGPETRDEGGLMWGLMMSILERPAADKPNYDIAMQAVDRLESIYPPDTYFVVWKRAEVFHAMGRLKEAVDLQKKVVKLLSAESDRRKGDRTSTSIVATHRTRLEEWERELAARDVKGAAGK